MKNYTFLLTKWFIPLTIWNDQEIRSPVVMTPPFSGVTLASSFVVDINYSPVRNNTGCSSSK